MKKAKLTAGKATAFAWLNSSKTSEAVWKSLPFRGTAHTWGKEIYFPVPVKMGEENARQVVNYGDLAYWPEGSCLCIFFGPTPDSQGNEIRPASPVNIVGRIINDPRVFENASAAEVVMDRVKGGVESIAIGTDERTPLVDSVLRYLDDRDLRYTLYEVAPWPDVAEKVGRSVALGQSDEGILLCWTGTGVSLAANKISGVRAVLCPDAAVAIGARKWNHANVLALGLGFTTPEGAREILDAWFSTPFDEEEVANVAKVAEMERQSRS